MSLESQMEREIESIEDEYTAGTISAEERNRQIREVERDAHAYLEEEAQNAYDDVMGDRW